MSWLTFLALVSLVQGGSPLPAATPDAPAAEEAGAGSGDAGDAAEPEAEPEPEPRAVVGGGEVALASTYVFRGVPQYPSVTTPSLQPSVYLDFDRLLPGALRVDVWSAFALVDRERASAAGSASEIDFMVVYEGTLARDYLRLGGGFFYYIYPGEEQVDGEKELMFDIGTNNLPVSISTAFFFEVHPGLALHIEPKVGWEQVHDTFTFGMDGVIGATVDRDGGNSLDHATLTAFVRQRLGRLSFGLSLSYTLRIAPSGLSFFERSLLYGALVFGVS